MRCRLQPTNTCGHGCSALFGFRQIVIRHSQSVMCGIWCAISGEEHREVCGGDVMSLMEGSGVGDVLCCLIFRISDLSEVMGIA